VHSWFYPNNTSVAHVRLITYLPIYFLYFLIKCFLHDRSHCLFATQVIRAEVTVSKLLLLLHQLLIQAKPFDHFLLRLPYGRILKQLR
jgi:hypothetical protein